MCNWQFMVSVFGRSVPAGLEQPWALALQYEDWGRSSPVGSRSVFSVNILYIFLVVDVLFKFLDCLILSDWYLQILGLWERYA
jgi:hypothetical protein